VWWSVGTGSFTATVLMRFWLVPDWNPEIHWNLSNASLSSFRRENLSGASNARTKLASATFLHSNLSLAVAVT